MCDHMRRGSECRECLTEPAKKEPKVVKKEPRWTGTAGLRGGQGQQDSEVAELIDLT